MPSPRLPPPTPTPPFAPGLRALQSHLVEMNPANERDPFIARGMGQPQWMGGFEALDGVFVFTSGESDSDDEPSVSFLASCQAFALVAFRHCF